MNAKEFINSSMRCPKCLKKLETNENYVKCIGCGEKYLFEKGVLVICPDDKYVSSFSLEWERNRFTQVDSKGYVCGYDGAKDSKDIFNKKTLLTSEECFSSIILDAGCGVGRFAEIVQPSAELLVCIDLSRASYLCRELLPQENVLVIKGDLENIPLVDGAVDISYSIGVLHHAKDPRKAFSEVIRVTKSGGIFSGWVYAHNKWAEKDLVLKIKNIVSKIDPSVLYELCELAPEVKRALRSFFKKVPAISGSKNDKECILDTFDWWSCQYRKHYDNNEVHKLLTELGCIEIGWGTFPVSFKCKKK